MRLLLLILFWWYPKIMRPISLNFGSWYLSISWTKSSKIKVVEYVICTFHRSSQLSWTWQNFFFLRKSSADTLILELWVIGWFNVVLTRMNRNKKWYFDPVQIQSLNKLTRGMKFHMTFSSHLFSLTNELVSWFLSFSLLSSQSNTMQESTRLNLLKNILGQMPRISWSTRLVFFSFIFDSWRSEYERYFTIKSDATEHHYEKGVT